MKILVVAPHPDDEVLGCGGTMKKYSARGEEVFLCIVTRPYTPDWSEEYIENKKKEIEASNNILGIKKTFFLDLPTVKLDTIPQKQLNDAIQTCVKEVNPEVVFIPFFGDINKDHQLVSEASMVVARPKPDSQIKKVFLYEVLSETEWAKPAQKIEEVFVPNQYEDISGFLVFQGKSSKGLLGKKQKDLKGQTRPLWETAMDFLFTINNGRIHKINNMQKLDYKIKV